jgi:alkylation response protein AidB-like acyl-CoA dehydrogenase
MDLRLSEEQALIKSSAREILEAECPMSHVREMEGDPTGYSAKLWRTMADLGWMGVAFPETYGGLGSGLLDLCLLIEEMGRARLPSPFVPTVVLCGMPILRFGSDAQKAAYLPEIAAGRRILTYAALEPGAGWRAGGMQCVATPDGDDLVITGTKLFVPYASAADELLVVTRHARGGEGQLTLVLVDAGLDGITRERLETVGGDHLEQVLFEGVRVAGDRVLGRVGEGGPIVEAIDRWGSAARCAEMVGGSERVLEMTLDYARERHQFGRPVGSFQALQHRCANMAIDVLGSRFITYEAIWCLDEGLDGSEIVSMAKAWTGAAYRRVCSVGHQIHGAIGYTREHNLHLYLRHAVASDLAFGDADFHRELVARQLGL